MNRYSSYDERPYVERRYMDDRVYRSGPSNGYSDLADSRTPRYSPSILREDHRIGYFGRTCEESYGRRSLSPYNRGFYGYDCDSRWGSDELIRRTNRKVAEVNGNIIRPSRDVQLHPMMTLDGQYPNYFRLPRRIEEFLYMDSRELDRIMMAYELGASRRRYYRGNLADRFENDDMFYNSNSGRRRDLIALFEFLGAHQLVEHLRYR